LLEKIKDLRVIICGGDWREVELFRIWEEKGLQVKTAGLERSEVITSKKIAELSDWYNADVIVMPIWGIEEGGNVKSKLTSLPLNVVNYLQSSRKKRLLLLSGSIHESVLSNISDRIRFIKTSEEEELTLLNSILTAEGAILHAMNTSNISINQSFCLVLGMGRCGTTLALRLKGLGAKVTVVVRREESQALAANYNLDSMKFEELDNYLTFADFIFNTVPEVVLYGNSLNYLNKDTKIIELASKPGGIDLEELKNSEIEVQALPGLPGKVAPKTAGENLHKVYTKLIIHHLDFLKGGDNDGDRK